MTFRVVFEVAFGVFGNVPLFVKHDQQQQTNPHEEQNMGTRNQTHRYPSDERFLNFHDH